MASTHPEIRYLTTDELTRLRRYAEARTTQARRETGAVTATRAWALLDTLLSSGLRTSEGTALRIGDCLLGYGQSSLVVRHGKGDKAREVFVPEELKRHLKAIITWKRDRSRRRGRSTWVPLSTLRVGRARNRTRGSGRGGLARRTSACFSTRPR